MSYQEIPCNTIKNIGNKSYRLRIYGIGNTVYEEHLVPIPTEKIIRTFKEDGTEDITKRKKVIKTLKTDGT